MIQKIGQNLLTLFLTLLLCSLVLEGTLRIQGAGRTHTERYTYVKHTFYNPFLIFGPNIDRRFPQDHANDAVYNSQGFREAEEVPVEKPAGEYRLFALGGSSTENLANGHDRHYCREAEVLLGNGVRCINAAKSGFSTLHTLIRLESDLLPFRPNMITVMHNVNDLTVNFFPADGRFNYGNQFFDDFFAPRFTNLQKSALRHSRAAVFLYRLWCQIKGRFFDEKIYTENGSYVTTTMQVLPGRFALPFAEVFRNQLKSIVAVAQAHGIRPVLMSQPAVFSEPMYALMFGHKEFNRRIKYPTLDEFQRVFSQYNKIVADVARAESVPFIDMQRLMGQDPKHYNDMIHYSREGVEHFARIYAENLRPLIVTGEALS
ncbi:MAG: GDSL-type esterase/lipase family protein [Candidatus Omnitrophota bacterium]|nr:GDSL-type esterase/lipase family protein [Candidatus Omnitrophota bacterium]